MTKASEKAWAPEHDATLIRMIGEKVQASAVAEALGRSAFSVRARARRLKVTFAHNAWPPELIERLRTMAAQGKTSAEIAEALGFERRALLDKASRLKISIVRAPPKPPAPTRLAKAFEFGAMARTATGAVAPLPVKTRGPTAHSLNIPMWEQRFTARCCKWPTSGEGAPEHLFCAAPKLPGLPYCGDHALAAYNPAPPKPPSAVKDTARVAPKAEDGEPRPLDFEGTARAA